jgi:hypothetical protein
MLQDNNPISNNIDEESVEGHLLESWETEAGELKATVHGVVGDGQTSYLSISCDKSFIGQKNIKLYMYTRKSIFKPDSKIQFRSDVDGVKNFAIDGKINVDHFFIKNESYLSKVRNFMSSLNGERFQVSIEGYKGAIVSDFPSNGFKEAMEPIWDYCPSG